MSDQYQQNIDIQQQQQHSDWNQQQGQPPQQQQANWVQGNQDGIQAQAGHVQDIPANQAQTDHEPTIADKVEGFLEKIADKFTKKS
jgi:hypothetical protein